MEYAEARQKITHFSKNEDRQKERFFQPKLTINAPNDIYEQEADAMADKVMRMPANDQSFFSPNPLSISGVQRKCAHCEEEEKTAQRKENNNNVAAAPSKTEDYINTLSGGKPLSKNERNFFEPRMGFDFSDVKIHTDADAAKSARSINALAYTTGNNIVFNEGQYSSGTENGKKLLGHELTHVVQQAGIEKKIQRACFDEDRPNRNLSACQEGSQDVGRQAPGQPNTRDAQADAIIATAQSTALSLQDKAMQVLNDIICTYMPTQASKVRKILYYSPETGLHTQSEGRGSSTRGDICVGDYFVNNTTRRGISRRVLQVAHELQHIDQYRGGMTGHNRSDEREFLAFYDEALADEFIGTSSMSDATRRSLIDGAIGYYYCLETTIQTTYAGRLQTLLTRRQSVNGTAHNTSTNPPGTCRRQ